MKSTLSDLEGEYISNDRRISLSQGSMRKVFRRKHVSTRSRVDPLINSRIRHPAKYSRCSWRSRQPRARSSGRVARCGCPSPHTSAVSFPSSAERKPFRSRDITRHWQNARSFASHRGRRRRAARATRGSFIRPFRPSRRNFSRRSNK